MITLSNRIDAAPPVVALISLGCAKTAVDSECILGNLLGAGFRVAEDPADADLCLVNTCGFIDDARAEAAKTLREVAVQKKSGRPRVVVALGCLVERIADCPALGLFLKKRTPALGFGTIIACRKYA